MEQQTNETLALRVQQGDKPALELLWNQVKAIAGVIARRLLSGHKERFESMATYEDLEQELFLAVWEAARDFDPEKGYAFTSYLKNHILTRSMALLGYRSSRRDALGYSFSIDREIPGSDDLTLGDTIPCEASERDFERAEDQIWVEQLRHDLEVALSDLDPRWAETLRLRYYQSQTLEEIGGAFSVSGQTVTEWERKAVQRLRKRRRLARHREEIISTHAYRSGPALFRKRGASSVELTVEKLEKVGRYYDLEWDEITADKSWL